MAVFVFEGVLWSSVNISTNEPLLALEQIQEKQKKQMLFQKLV